MQHFTIVKEKMLHKNDHLLILNYHLIVSRSLQHREAYMCVGGYTRPYIPTYLGNIFAGAPTNLVEGRGGAHCLDARLVCFGVFMLGNSFVV